MDQSGYNNNYFGPNWNQYHAERRYTENPMGGYYETKDRPSCSYGQTSSSMMNLQNSFFPAVSENVWNGHTQNLEAMYYNSMTLPSSGSNFDSLTYPVSGSNFDIHQSKDVMSSHEGFSSPHSTSEDLESSQRRTTFTKVQLQKLEERFLAQSFLSRDERIEFSYEIGLTERQIMIWFQNRRSRLKKRGPTDKAYQIKYLQNQEFMEQLKNSERVFPFFERTQKQSKEERKDL